MLGDVKCRFILGEKKMKIEVCKLSVFSLMAVSMRCAVLIACVFVSSIVSAHNVLKSSVPADGATLLKPRPAS